MKEKIILLLVCIFLFKISFSQYIQYTNSDPRFVSNGNVIPSHTYADQPYVIVCDDGSWLCILTTSSGTEYAKSNYIISTKSYDQGKTWTKPVEVEAPGVPQSAWAVPLKVPGGRIYVFYNYNQGEFKGIEGVMSGPFMFKYSDDNGKTWSEKRYEAPIRRTKIDTDNHTNGKTCFFWSIDKPIVTNKAAYITFSKIFRETSNQPEFYKYSEGFILKSENILTEKNPEKIEWLTYPEGDKGIMYPKFGRVQAEHNSVILNNGNIYTVYRTIDGFPAYAISIDDGKTFSTPKYMHYANGNLIGNPRACPKIYKTEEGKYLFWFHNNFRQNSYNGRNPVWLTGGIEKDGNILWSQPEIILYDDDPELLGMSYPDYIEQGGRLWISETEKSVARVHEIDLDLVQGMWNQGKLAMVTKEGLIMDSEKDMLSGNHINFPQLPNLATGGGFSVELWLRVDNTKAGQEIFSTIGAKHKGIQVLLAEGEAIAIRISDGAIRENVLKGQTFVSDANTITPGKLHHVVFILDGAAKIASIIIDGIMSDGSVDTRPYGWGRINPHMEDMNDTYKCTLNPDFSGEINQMRIYNRYLRTSEAIANFNAGLKMK